MKNIRFPIPTKVLYFNSNTQKTYINLYYRLKEKFDGLTQINVDDVDNFFMENIDERFYIKEYPYQLELYNPECEYIFCINKPIL